MIQEIIDAKLKEEQDKKSTRVRSGKFSPSSFGKCYRSQIWNRKNEPVTNPPDERTLRVFSAGHLFHDFVQRYLPDSQTEVECKGENVYGRADIVLNDTVIDLKSVHSKAFWYMTRPNYDVKSDKLSNWLQVTCYALILGKPRVGLVFISKDDMCIQEYYFDAKDFEHLLKTELTTLKEYWDKDELPPAEPRAYNGSECKFCGFVEKCLALGDNKYWRINEGKLESLKDGEPNINPKGRRKQATKG